MSVGAERLRLVVVTPGRGDVPELRRLARAAFAGGATALWVRERSLEEGLLRDLLRHMGDLALEMEGAILVSGRDDLVREFALDGVHVGFRDDSPARIKERLGGAALVGWSAHRPVRSESLRGADYATLSPIFPTPHKNPSPAPLGLDRFARLARRMPLPVLGLGGIDLSNGAAVLRAGADGLAVMRAVTQAGDPRRATLRLRHVIDNALG